MFTRFLGIRDMLDEMSFSLYFEMYKYLKMAK